MSADEQRAFQDAMLDLYRRALKECRYNATVYLNMIQEHGGLEAAKLLLRPGQQAASGLTTLWELKRLDLSVEALVRDEPRWAALFTDAEHAEARQRLDDFEYPRPT
jgi:hypothetical protein